MYGNRWFGLLLFLIVCSASVVLIGCGEKPKSFEQEAEPPASENNSALAATVAPLDWCAGHGVPESMCTKCNPSLIPQFQAAGDWCEEHGFPESVCPSCNPLPAPGPASQAIADWCLEHSLPESKCTRCNPSLIPQFQTAGDWCEEHGFPESACPFCNPQQPPAGAEKAAIEARIVRFRSPEIEEAAGIRTAVTKRAQAVPFVECTAHIAFDINRVADVHAIVAGIVRRIRVDLGARVVKGDPLFELESTRVAEIQAALQRSSERVRTAQADLTRQQELHERGIAAKRQVEVAEQELAAAQAEARAAEAALRMAGASQAIPSGRYTLVAPISGTIVRRPAVVGLLATESTSLAVVANTSVMWALCDVPEENAASIALGQKVQVMIQGGNDRAFQGEITWIAAEVDPRTRTVTARAEVSNPLGRLRANQFARARIETSTPRAAVMVPRASIQRVGEREVVFVRTAPGTYAPRVVSRRGRGNLVQVEGNLRVGDAIVTTGAILLRTEIMPGSIGAGCCEIDLPGGN